LSELIETKQAFNPANQKAVAILTSSLNLSQRIKDTVTKFAPVSQYAGWTLIRFEKFKAYVSLAMALFQK
jgi:hypothetical protein